MRRLPPGTASSPFSAAAPPGVALTAAVPPGVAPPGVALPIVVLPAAVPPGVALTAAVPPGVALPTVVLQAAVPSDVVPTADVPPAVVLPVAALLLFAVVSVVLVITDVRWRRLPDVIVLPATAAAVFVLSIAAASDGRPARAADVGLGALGAFGACLVVRLARPEAFGGGDVKLAALVGAHLGWFGPEAVASGVAVGFVAAGIAAVGVLAAGARGASVPFGPFLLLGAWARILAEAH